MINIYLLKVDNKLNFIYHYSMSKFYTFIFLTIVLLEIANFLLFQLHSKYKCLNCKKNITNN